MSINKSKAVKDILNNIKYLNADEFEALLIGISGMAYQVYRESDDDAWNETASYLRAAADVIAERSGN